MKKIPTLFERVYEGRKVVGVTDIVTPGMEWVLRGEGLSTIKVDGSCTCLMGGNFYKRYDAKHGKTPPSGAIPCCDPDPVTGHWPHWVKVQNDAKEDRWFVEAFTNTFLVDTDGHLPRVEEGTYEAVGPHFRGNPYKLDKDILVKHGSHVVIVPRTFEHIQLFLEWNKVEGLVFWRDDEPQCKIKRTDFGYEWPVEGACY